MKIFLKIGIKNIFRNKRRSFLTLTIISMGLAALIITDGFIKGMIENMVKTITQGIVSEGQIHNPEFTQSYNINDVVLHRQRVERLLENEELVASFSKRVIVNGMLSSPRNMKNIALYGIDPSRESMVSRIDKNLIEGKFLPNEKSIYLGKKLFKKLELNIGEKLVLTVSQAGSGEISQEQFRVHGIFQTGSKDLDEGVAFIHINQAQKILNLGTDYHEIALKFHDRVIGENKNHELWNKLNSTGNTAETWKEVMSSFTGMLSYIDISLWITSAILMILVGIGIINTLFMALHERLFEFSVLRALGTKSRDIFLMIVAEALGMGFISLVIGIVLTCLFAYPLMTKGIDYGGMEFAEVTLREPIYYIPSIRQFILYPAGTLIFTVLVSLYPAIYAAKMSIHESLKKTL